MARPLSITAASFCGLLALAPWAAAECAWVLWSGILTEPMQWFPLDAFSSRDECHERLEALGRRVGGVYKCLPDTIDARGPRGSEPFRPSPEGKEPTSASGRRAGTSPLG